MSNLICALKDGKAVSISDVERGLACGCTCPACGGTLIARKGTKMVHHFAHQSGVDCEHGYETSLHLAAKEILSKAEWMMVSPVTLYFPESTKRCIQVEGPRRMKIDSVELEKRHGGVIPDVVVHSGGKPVFVEIFVIHRIDDEKLGKLEELGISTLEIDLSGMDGLVTEEMLEEILLGSGRKEWKYHAGADRYLKRFYEVSDRLGLVYARRGCYAAWCPSGRRHFEGKPYADYVADCRLCPYFIAKQEDTILCTGRQKVSTIKDLERAEDGLPHVPDERPFFEPEQAVTAKGYKQEHIPEPVVAVEEHEKDKEGHKQQDKKMSLQEYMDKCRQGGEEHGQPDEVALGLIRRIRRKHAQEDRSQEDGFIEYVREYRRKHAREMMGMKP